LSEDGLRILHSALKMKLMLSKKTISASGGY
jgi:hypothetical protein